MLKINSYVNEWLNNQVFNFKFFTAVNEMTIKRASGTACIILNITKGTSMLKYIRSSLNARET